MSLAVDSFNHSVFLVCLLYHSWVLGRLLSLNLHLVHHTPKFARKDLSNISSYSGPLLLCLAEHTTCQQGLDIGSNFGRQWTTMTCFKELIKMFFNPKANRPCEWRKNFTRRKDGKGGFARLLGTHPKCRLHRKTPTKTKTSRISPNSKNEDIIQSFVRASIDDANNNNAKVMFPKKFVLSTSNS